MGIFRKIQHFSCSLVIYVVTLFLLLTTVPIAFAMLLPFITYRQIVICAARILKPEMGKVLSSRSIPAACEDLYEKPRMTIVFGIVCEGNNLELKEIREIVQREAVLLKDTNGVLQYPELRQNVKSWMGYSFWSHVKNFDIEDHINYFDDSENGELNASELSHHLRTLSLSPFSKNKALWEMKVVPNFIFDSENTSKHFLLLFRCHHCLADGLSLLQLFDKFTFTKKVLLNPKLKRVQNHNFLLHSLLLFAKLPHDLGKVMFRTEMMHGKILWKEPILQKKVSHKILKKLMPTISEDGTFSGAVSKEFPFSRIQVLSKQYRVTGTSIMLAGVGAVVRNFMLRCQAQDKLNNVQLHVMFPLPRPSDKLRNNAMITSMLLPIEEEDSVKRLLRIEKALSAAKSSSLVAFMVHVVAILSVLPSFILRKGIGLSHEQHKIVFTNFPGPIQPMDVFGAVVKRIHFTCGMVKDSNTLGMALGTYAENVSFSVAADHRLLTSCEEAKFCVDVFFKELEILEQQQSFVV